MIGNFVDAEPTEKAVNASLQVIEYVKSIQSNLELNYEFITHDDAIIDPDAATGPDIVSKLFCRGIRQ